MDTRYLRSFLRTADLRSISRAAESLGIAQPSLSQQLLRLEDEVGFRLFNRTARGVTVTEAGRIFQEHARHILRNIDQAFEDVQAVNAAASGQAVIAMPYSINRLVGVELVEAVMAQSPNTSVRLVEAPTGHIRGWLDTARIDLGILHDLGPIRHLSTRPLASEELYLVGPPDRFASNDEDVSVTGLSHFPIVTLGPQHGLRKLLDHEAARLGFSHQVRHEIDAVRTIVALVARGHGFTILPKPAFSAEANAGEVSFARIENGILRRTLCLVRNPTQVVTHASARVEDLLIRIITSFIDAGDWEAEKGAALQ